MAVVKFFSLSALAISEQFSLSTEKRVVVPQKEKKKKKELFKENKDKVNKFCTNIWVDGTYYYNMVGYSCHGYTIVRIGVLAWSATPIVVVCKPTAGWRSAPA